MTLLDIIRRAESGCNRQERLREKLSRRKRDRLSPLASRINERQENKTERLRNYSRAGICDRSHCETRVLSRIRRRIRFTPLHPVAFNDEYLSNQAKQTQLKRNEDGAGVRDDFMRRELRNAVSPSIRNGADSIFTDVNFRAVCYCSPYADDVYRNRALFRCPVTSRARGPFTGMRFAAVISFRDRIPETQRFAGLFQQQRASLHIRLRRISLCAQISAGRPVENSDICFLLLVVPPTQARVVLKCIKQQQLTRYQVRVSWEEVGDRCGPGNDWSRVPLALESRRPGFPPSIPCSNRKIPWITDVIS